MSLIRDLLDIVSAENTATPALLARRLDVSQGLVELMLADLERAGYLQTIADDCSGCAGCGLRQTCHKPGPRLRVRTGKS